MEELIKYITWFPGNIMFITAAVLIVLFVILAKKGLLLGKKGRRVKRLLAVVIVICIAMPTALILYGVTGYKSDKGALRELAKNSDVQIIQLKDGVFIDGEGSDTALVLYPGARVEYTAYEPLMVEIAEMGIDCFIMEMPYNLAMFGINNIEELMSAYGYDHWFLAGHSLGGAMGERYAAKNSDKLEGMIYLGAYSSTDLSDTELRVLAIYGSEDEVLSWNKFEKGRANMPKDYTEVCIEGGNHGQFGDYGQQKGDGTAFITKEEQWAQTSEVIAGWIEESCRL